MNFYRIRLLFVLILAAIAGTGIAQVGFVSPSIVNFESTLPPANPQPGWKWYKTDTDSTFRWNDNTQLWEFDGLRGIKKVFQLSDIPDYAEIGSIWQVENDNGVYVITNTSNGYSADGKAVRSLPSGKFAIRQPNEISYQDSTFADENVSESDILNLVRFELNPHITAVSSSASSNDNVIYLPSSDSVLRQDFTLSVHSIDSSESYNYYLQDTTSLYIIIDGVRVPRYYPSDGEVLRLTRSRDSGIWEGVSQGYSQPSLITRGDINKTEYLPNTYVSDESGHTIRMTSYPLYGFDRVDSIIIMPVKNKMGGENLFPFSELVGQEGLSNNKWLNLNDKYTLILNDTIHPVTKKGTVTRFTNASGGTVTIRANNSDFFNNVYEPDQELVIEYWARSGVGTSAMTTRPALQYSGNPDVDGQQQALTSEWKLYRYELTSLDASRSISAIDIEVLGGVQGDYFFVTDPKLSRKKNDSDHYYPTLDSMYLGGTLYANTLFTQGKIEYDDFRGVRGGDGQSINYLSEFCQEINGCNEVYLNKNVYTDTTILGREGVTINGNFTGSAISGSNNFKLQGTTIFFDLKDSNAVAFQATGISQISGVGIQNVNMVPLSPAKAAIATGDAIHMKIKDVRVSSDDIGDTDSLKYGILFEAGSLEPLVENVDIDSRNVGFKGVSNNAKLINCKYVGGDTAVHIQSGSWEIHSLWAEDLSGPGVVFDAIGGELKMFSPYFEHVPMENSGDIPSMALNTGKIVSIKGGSFHAKSPVSNGHFTFFIDSIGSTTIESVDLVGAYRYVGTTQNTGSVNLKGNAYSQTELIPLDWEGIYDKTRVILEGNNRQQGGANSTPLEPSRNWIPRQEIEGSNIQESRFKNNIGVSQTLKDTLKTGKIAFVAIGGNYAQNSGINNSDGWADIAGNAQLILNDTVDHHGVDSAAARVVKLATNTDPVDILRNTSFAPALDTGSYLSVRFWARNSANNPDNKLMVELSGEYLSVDTFDLKTTWDQYEYTFVADEGTLSAPFIDFRYSGDSSDYFFLDELQIELSPFPGQYIETTNSAVLWDYPRLDAEKIGITGDLVRSNSQTIVAQSESVPGILFELTSDGNYLVNKSNVEYPEDFEITQMRPLIDKSTNLSVNISVNDTSSYYKYIMLPDPSQVSAGDLYIKDNSSRQVSRGYVLYAEGYNHIRGPDGNFIDSLTIYPGETVKLSKADNYWHIGSYQSSGLNPANILNESFYHGQRVGRYIIRELPNPRYNNGNPDSILIIPVRNRAISGDNFILNSEEIVPLTAWVFADNPNRITPLENFTNSPYNEKTAECFIKANTSTNARITQTTDRFVHAGDTLVNSIWVKGFGGDNDLDLEATLGVSGNTVVYNISSSEYDLSWKRFEFIVPISAPGNHTVQYKFVGDQGDTLCLYNPQSEFGLVPSQDKPTKSDSIVENVLYAHYQGVNRKIDVDEIINSIGDSDTDLIQSSLDYAKVVKGVDHVNIGRDYTITSIAIPSGVILSGNRKTDDTENQVTLFINSPNPSNSGIILGENNSEPYQRGLGIKDLSISATNKTHSLVRAPYALQKPILKNVVIDGMHKDSTDFGLKIEENSTNTTLFPHLENLDIISCGTGYEIYANLGLYKDVQASRGKVGAVILTGSHTFIAPRWEDFDTTGLRVMMGERISVISGYVEDIPEVAFTSSRTWDFRRVNNLYVNGTKLGPIKNTLDNSSTIVYLDSIGMATIENNTIQSAGDALPLRTTDKTRSVNWSFNTHLSSSLVDVISWNGITDSSKVVVVGNNTETGVNEEVTDYWMPRIKSTDSYFKNSVSDDFEVNGRFNLRQDTVNLNGHNNLIRYSDQLIHFTNDWNNSSGQTSFSNDTDNSPIDSSTTADRVSYVSGNGTFAYTGLSGLLKPNQWYVISYYARTHSAAGTQTISINISNGLSNPIDTISSTWRLYTHAIKTSSSTAGSAVSFDLSEGVVVVDAFQLAEGTQPGNYVATNGTAVIESGVHFKGEASFDQAIVAGALVKGRLIIQSEVDHTGSPYTADVNQEWHVNVSSGAATVNLPSSPSQGDRVGFLDSQGNAATNNITIARNGNNIEGLASDLIINGDFDFILLEYKNSTVGWKTVLNN